MLLLLFLQEVLTITSNFHPLLFNILFIKAWLADVSYCYHFPNQLLVILTCPGLEAAVLKDIKYRLQEDGTLLLLCAAVCEEQQTDQHQEGGEDDEGQDGGGDNLHRLAPPLQAGPEREGPVHVSLVEVFPVHVERILLRRRRDEPEGAPVHCEA